MGIASRLARAREVDSTCSIRSTTLRSAASDTEGADIATEMMVGIAASGMTRENTESAKTVIGTRDLTTASMMTMKQLLHDGRQDGICDVTLCHLEVIADGREHGVLDLGAALAKNCSQNVEVRAVEG